MKGRQCPFFKATLDLWKNKFYCFTHQAWRLVYYYVLFSKIFYAWLVQFSSNTTKYMQLYDTFLMARNFTPFEDNSTNLIKHSNSWINLLQETLSTTICVQKLSRITVCFQFCEHRFVQSKLYIWLFKTTPFVQITRQLFIG